MTVSGKLNTLNNVTDASPLQPTPMASFLIADPAATRRTEYRWVPWARGINLDFTRALFLPISLRVPFIFILLSPEPRAVLAWRQRWGNIFTFLPSFSWPCYIRKIPAAQGKEVEGGEERWIRDQGSVLISPLLCSLSRIHCPQDNGRLSHRRTGVRLRPTPSFHRWRTGFGPGVTCSRSCI